LQKRQKSTKVEKKKDSISFISSNTTTTSGDHSETNSGVILRSQFTDGGFGDIGQQWNRVVLKNSKVINQHISFNIVLPDGSTDAKGVASTTAASIMNNLNDVDSSKKVTAAVVTNLKTAAPVTTAETKPTTAATSSVSKVSKASKITASTVASTVAPNKTTTLASAPIITSSKKDSTKVSKPVKEELTKSEKCRACKKIKN
jgi:hypothetical protein